MKSICFYFQIHQPFRLKRYRFFNIGADHHYFDDANNEAIIKRIAQNSYIPANNAMLQMIKESKGAFKVAYSISGLALEQLEQYCPEVIDSFKKLAKTGCVEFLGETYAHSFASLRKENNEFEKQVEAHSKKIEALFGQKPKVFRNSELLFCDDMVDRVANMGFDGMLAEGAPQTLDWKSPNYVYCSAANQRMKLLLKNCGMSDDIAYRFSDWGWKEFPLTADKFANWIMDNPNEQVVNLFMNYEVLGEIQNANTGIFDFFKALPKVAASRGIKFATPSEVINNNKPADQISAPHPTTWANATKDLSPWLANSIQNEAFNKLFALADKVNRCSNKQIVDDWYKLQSTDHLYYMSTAYYNQTFCPYDSPYDAFINYMNVMSDFSKRVDSFFPANVSEEELNSLVKEKLALEAELAALKAGKKAPKAEKKAEEKPVKKATKKAVKAEETKPATTEVKEKKTKKQTAK
ncbi:MAG: glycoside hydrolase family 57 protein [Bacteroidales bacterium]|nr:glycoside hydrolase family 57 protein [Candidatus Scybalocola fimicaballi]